MASSSATKRFVLDCNQKDSNAWWQHVTNVIAPGFTGFGKNLDAFADILRGGFGSFAEGEAIIVVLHHTKKLDRVLGPKAPTVLEILRSAANVKLIVE